MKQGKLEVELYRVAGESKVTVYVGESGVRVEFSGLNSERLFEHLPRGRDYRLVPYIMSRICGVCSQAHFWASNLAIENALGIEVDEVTAEIRDVCNKLQIFENHLVHLFVMALPDYAEPGKEVVLRLLKARALALDALSALCGRITSPQSYQPGGFTKELASVHIERAIAAVENLENLADEILSSLVETIELSRLVDPSPDYVALSSWPEKSVPYSEPYILEGSLGSIRVTSENYTEYFREVKPGYSNSKVCTLSGRVFFVGARARLLARRYVQVDKPTLEAMESNPYGNLLAKIFEARYVLADVAQRLRGISGRTPRKTQPRVKSGRGLALVEAPRGLLLHYYEIGEDGRVAKVNVITPTVMFARHIEQSAEVLVRKLQEDGVDVSTVSSHVEKLVRSYDPCIPCAVHVVKVGSGEYR